MRYVRATHAIQPQPPTSQRVAVRTQHFEILQCAEVRYRASESKVTKEQFLQVCHCGDDCREFARVEVVVAEMEIAELVLLHKSAQHLPGDRALWEDNGRDGQIINGSEID